MRYHKKKGPPPDFDPQGRPIPIVSVPLLLSYFGGTAIFRFLQYDNLLADDPLLHMTTFHQINSYAHAQHPDEQQFGNWEPEIRDAVTLHGYSRQCFHGMGQRNDLRDAKQNRIRDCTWRQYTTLMSSTMIICKTPINELYSR